MAELSQQLGDALAQVKFIFASPEIEGERLEKLSLDALLSQVETANPSRLRALLPYSLEKLAESAHRCRYDVVVQALHAAEWRTWSREEQAAIEGFFVAQWQSILQETPPNGTNSLADEFLSAVDGIMDIQALLEDWLKSRARHSVAHMASAIVYGKQTVEKMGRYLAQSRILQRIEAAFWDCHSDELAALYSKAAEMLRSNERVMA